jgi:cephalosporin-C deacetylase-like acetyl esterase
VTLPAPPPDFEGYWRSVDVDLARFQGRPELTLDPLRSSEISRVYRLRITSVGPYRIFGYYSVPAGEGPFPALLLTPRYGSVNHIPDFNDRSRYVCLQVMHRGQRLADQPFAARYPGLLTHGIDDAETYIYRDIVADCLRAAEFIFDQPEVDRTRMAIVGDDLALITAARRSGFSTLQAAGLVFYRLMEACSRTSAYPVEEINDFVRVRPEAAEEIERTVSYFDPRHHAASIESRVTLSVDGPGALGGPEWLQPLFDALGANVYGYTLNHEGGTDHDRLDALLAERMGVPAMSRFRREL